MAGDQKVCPNCGTAVSAEQRYCGHCGQEQRDLHIRFVDLLRDFVAANFNFDTRFVQTLKYLLFRPGKLMQEFSEGRRASYVPPVRLYFFTSFIFFLVINADFGSPDRAVMQFGADGASFEIDTVAADNEPFLAIGDEPFDASNDKQVDSLLVDMGFDDSNVARHLVKQLGKLNSKDPMVSKAYNREFNRNLSIAMFFLMPVFGLLLWLFWKKPKPYYIDALIFSIHLHSFAFILFTVVGLLTLLSSNVNIYRASFVVLLVYLLFGLKRIESTTFWRALGKSLALSLSYFLVCMVALGSIAVISVAMF